MALDSTMQSDVLGPVVRLDLDLGHRRPGDPCAARLDSLPLTEAGRATLRFAGCGSVWSLVTHARDDRRGVQIALLVESCWYPAHLPPAVEDVDSKGLSTTNPALPSA